MSVVNLITVGDISLETKISASPFGRVKEAFRDKDILFGNLETVLSNKGKKAEKAVLFYTFPKRVEFLKDAGFDILNVANNHILDLGPEGFNETLEVLNHNDLLFIGAGNRKFNHSYAIIERKGIRLGFLGYYEGGFKNFKEDVFINRFDKYQIVADLKDLRLKCDFIIISLHWGIENVFYPSAGQQCFARDCVDTGASVILGHHSHRFQGVEEYHKGLIFYSLGNFNFQPCGVGITPYPDLSAIADIQINDDGTVSYELIPIKIDENYCPRPIKNREMIMEFQTHVSNISDCLRSEIDKWWWFGEIAKPFLIGNGKSFLSRIRRYGGKHFFQMLQWLFSRFVLKCFMGLVLRWLYIKKRKT